jgi:hypothetical protein
MATHGLWICEVWAYGDGMIIKATYSCTTCGIDRDTMLMEVERPDAAGKWLQTAKIAVASAHASKSPECRPETPNDELIGLSAHFEPVR